MKTGAAGDYFGSDRLGTLNVRNRVADHDHVARVRRFVPRVQVGSGASREVAAVFVMIAADDVLEVLIEPEMAQFAVGGFDEVASHAPQPELVKFCEMRQQFRHAGQHATGKSSQRNRHALGKRVAQLCERRLRNIVPMHAKHLAQQTSIRASPKNDRLRRLDAKSLTQRLIEGIPPRARAVDQGTVDVEKQRSHELKWAVGCESTGSTVGTQCPTSIVVSNVKRWQLNSDHP
jgi:hypothetical protein